jgi:peptidoglycan hydrolase CwlO-like protein
MTPSQDFPPQSITLDQRVSRLEDRQIDLRMAVSSLVDTVNLHQTNFETMQRNIELILLRMQTTQSEIKEMQSEIKEMQSEIKEMQLDIKGLQAENRRILDYLLGQQSD